MKFLIWFGCIFVLSLITVLLKYAGVLLGFIPTFILGSLMFWSARTLCKKYDVYKENKKKLLVNKQINTKKDKYDLFMISSVISFAYTLFVVFDVVFFGYYDEIGATIGMLLFYVIPLVLFFINQYKKRKFIDVVLILWTIFLLWYVVALVFFTVFPDISIEIENSCFILIISTALQVVFSLVPFLNMIKNLHYNSIKYREKCYKKVADMQVYLEKGIITQEEFEKNKKDILKRIKIETTNTKKIGEEKTISNEESTKLVDTKKPAPLASDDVSQEKVETVKIGAPSDEEWEYLYKTDYEKFWKMVLEEYDLSKLPDTFMSFKNDTMIYGEDARKMHLSHLKGVVEYSEWMTKNHPEVINRYWNTLKELKKELQEKTSDKVYMLDVIRNYEDKYIRY